MVSALSRWRWVIGAAAVCAVYLVVRSIADLHTAFGGGSAVDYLAIASAGRVVHAGSSCVYCVSSLAAAQAQLLGYMPAASATFPVPFVNPALMAWLIQPLAVLPLQTGTDAVRRAQRGGDGAVGHHPHAACCATASEDRSRPASW